VTPRRIVVVTTTRADYGLLRHIIAALAADKRAAVQLVVGGAHLERRFGSTVKEIIADGVPIAARVRFDARGDDGAAAAGAMGVALSGFGAAFRRLKPDVVLLLGDRSEILAAAAAATLNGAVVAHLNGGEVTQGSLDESWRHAITKIAHMHFPSTTAFARRIRMMGEDPWRIHVVGSSGVEAIRRERLLTRAELQRSIGHDLRAPLAVVTYHPVTNDPAATEREIAALTDALTSSDLGTIVFTGVNADPGGRAVARVITRAAKADPRIVRVPSLGSRRYLSLLRAADVMLGNSSSGLLEAPSFGLPAINIGRRQEGRLRGANVIDVPGDARAIGAALDRALRPTFRARLRSRRNPYGDGHTSNRVRARLLGPLDVDRLRAKRFADSHR